MGRPRKSNGTNTKAAQPVIKRDVNAAIRAKKALEYRLLGHTYSEIAERAGYSGKSAAYHAIQRELSRTLLEPAEDVKTLELHRLDILLENQLKKVLENGNWNHENVRQCLAIMERRSKYLGLDVEPSGAMTAQVLIREYAVPLEGV